MSDIATELGVSVDTVERELKRAAQRGQIEEVREKLRDTLAKTPDVYADILSRPVEELQKNSRGYKLKLDAANGLNTGLGAFRPESVSTKTNITLSDIAAEQAPHNVTPSPLTHDRFGNPLPKRLSFSERLKADKAAAQSDPEADTVDAEPVPAV